MKIVLRTEAGDHKAKPPYKDANVVDVATLACPHCEAKPLRVQGGETSIEADRVYVAKAWCVGCKETVGSLRVTPPSLFGLEEDQAIENSRCRKY